jgi:PhzF family phenazine biosynthesis protein
MIDIPFYWLDIFTSEPFKGNPAVVCLVDTELEDSIYLSIAKELNLSETAFTQKTGEGKYKLRWFSPSGEVSLCGHATIATAYTLSSEYDEQSPITFQTMSGEMTAEVKGNQVTLNFPQFPFTKSDEDEIAGPLGIQMYEELYSSDAMRGFMFLLDSREQVEQVSPDFRAFREYCQANSLSGAVITAQGDGDYDYVCRVFMGGVGREDPVTGLAQCGLAPYWGKVLGKSEMKCYQLSKRGGELSVEVVENGVRITGSATMLIKGTLCI